MSGKLPWENLTDQQLLQLPLKSLKLEIKGSYVEKAIVQVRCELRAKGLRHFKPHFWLSDEWFCPDGIAGVAIPFYLMHPRLIELEKQYNDGEAEGDTYEHCLKLLRHEVGHAFENAYKLRDHWMRIEAFGDSKKRIYPAKYQPKKYSKNFVKHLEANYAQSHPDEDFAESFAVWLTPGSNWRQTYKAWPALFKLEVVEALVKEHKNQIPYLKNKFRSAPIDQQLTTLGEYLQAKKNKHLQQEIAEENYRGLFVESDSTQAFAANYIRHHREEIKDKVSQLTGQPEYKIEHVVSKLIRKTKKKKLTVNRKNPKKKLALLDLVTAESLEELHSRKHHFIL